MGDLNSPTLIVALLQVKAEPWQSIYEKGQLPTWIQKCPDSIQIVNVYGKQPNNFIRSLDKFHEKLRWNSYLRLILNIFDRFLNVFLRKMNNPKWTAKKDEKVINLNIEVTSTNLTLPNVEIALFKYFLNSTDANYLYISNTSSYLNLDNLLKLIESFPKEKVYGGTMVQTPQVKFASGANRIISRDLVKYLVDNFNKWEFQYLCDLSMGKLLAGQNLNEVEIPSLGFKSVSEILETDLSSIKSSPHFRLKSGTLKSRSDHLLMQKIHEIIYP